MTFLSFYWLKSSMAYLTTGEAEVKVKWSFKMHDLSLPHQPNNRKNSSQKKKN